MNYQSKKMPEACEGMADIRTEIDNIDEVIVGLIGQRAQYVKAAAKFKTSETSVRAPERFKAMLQQRRVWAEQQGLNPDMIEKLYRNMVEHFIAEEMQEWQSQ